LSSSSRHWNNREKCITLTDTCTRENTGAEAADIGITERNVSL